MTRKSNFLFFTMDCLWKKNFFCRLILKLENFIFFCFHWLFLILFSSISWTLLGCQSWVLGEKMEKKTKHLGPRFYLFGTMQRCRFIQELSGVFRGDARMQLKQGGQKVSLLYMSTNSEFITTKMHKDTSA